MKTFLVLLLAFSTNALAASIPLTEELENRLFAVESKLLPSSAKGLARAVWDVSANSNMGSSTVDSGTHPLGAKLPKGAIITDSYGYIITPAEKAAPVANVAFTCEDSGNILAATDLSKKGAGQLFAGAARGVSSVAGGTVSLSGAVAGIAAPCEISAVITTNAWTAGKVVMFVEYVLSGE